MMAAAERIARLFSSIRVDMYCEGDDWRIGEITNCPMSGNWSFKTREAEQLVARVIAGEPAH